MALNHIQSGKTITLNNAAALIKSGAPVLIGDLFGVALVDIPSGSSGEVATEEVYALPKATGAMTVGQIVYWDPAGTPVGAVGPGALTTTAGSLKRAGIVWAAAASDATTVNVKLNA